MTTIKIPTTPTLIQDLGQIEYGRKGQKQRYGIYQCECGNEFKTAASKIKNGHTKSCGCYVSKLTIERSTTHGLIKHPMYKSYEGMMTRCYNTKRDDYIYYGGRGITMCDEWRNNFKAFYDDMYLTYQEGLSIDRINNDGNYEPSNCRWATKETQMRNTRKIKSTNKSGYRGVSFDKQEKKWLASIRVGGKQKHIGRFQTALESAKAYDAFVIDNNLEHTKNFVI